MRIPQLPLCALFATLLAGPALAGPPDVSAGGNGCPVGLVNGMTLDEEFGPGSQELTECNKVRHNVKLLIQLNQYGSGAPGGAYGLNNIKNVIDDYEITYGMRPGKDYEIVAVVHSSGGPLVLQNGVPFTGMSDGLSHNTINAYEADVSALIDKGVQFLFCQNTTRGYQKANKLPADATSALIPGVGYVTAGIAAIADFQARGYRYVQP
jgi:intracellular sulfur oxidation DsrE/DsrF family protein